MHKILFLLLISTSYLFSAINVVVSILPQKTFLEAIGGEKVDVTLMVKPGNSPHTYEPKPSQMVAISNAMLYFAIDVEFEKVWLPKFHSLNSKMKIIDIAKGVKKIPMHKPHTVKESTHHEHHHEGKDPHIWTSPDNVKIIAKNIYEALILYDADNAAYYTKNYHDFLEYVSRTDAKIKALLSSLKESRSFMVFHPSWGYFAKAYDLKQIAVEVEGKSPKPKELMHLIEEAKEEKVRAIFTQPEFSDASAKIIANELHIPVVKVSPLARNWSENLMKMAKAIAGHI